MKYCLAMKLSLISLFSPYFLEGAYGIFMKDFTIAHPETGLFFDCVGLYTPSETIIHNSAIFPMTTATCHFLPLSAAETVPSCNITTKRHKRLVGAVISLGIGAINLAISTANTIQLASLQQQVVLVEKSLSSWISSSCSYHYKASRSPTNRFHSQFKIQHPEPTGNRSSGHH